MNTVLVTGAKGQLGSSLRSQAGMQTGFDFIFTDIEELDICDEAAVETFVEAHQIDYIINCAAYTAVDQAEEEAEKCDRINHLAVANIAKAAKKTAAKVLHVSTDYVFDGCAHLPYKEEDEACPTSVYGKSKRKGEEALLTTCADSAVIVRTAWLYSEYGHNFLKTMLQLGDSKSQLKVVVDQIGTPTYAQDLAAALLAILDQAGKGIFLPGIYHYTNEGVCSWYDFALKIMELAELPAHVLPIESKDYPSKADRPHYSVLNKSKIKRDYQVDVPHWEKSLRLCLERLLKTE